MYVVASGYEWSYIVSTDQAERNYPTKELKVKNKRP